MNKIKFPLVLKPSKISNYMQIMMELQKIQKKNGQYSVLPVKTPYSNVLKKSKEEYDINLVLDGFVNEKLYEKLYEHETKLDKNFEKSVKKYIDKLKKQNEIVTTQKFNDLNVETLESSLSLKPNENLFGDLLLYDLYIFLTKSKPSVCLKQEIMFLGAEYFKYIERFLNENFSQIDSKIEIKDKISKFVKLKYSQEEYKLEIYEGRYVFAELYICLRCGHIDILLNLLEEFGDFLDIIEPCFRKNFKSWIISKTTSPLINISSVREDRFRKILFSLMQEKKLIQDSLILSTVEDFLWSQVIKSNFEENLNDIKKQFCNYKNLKGLILAYIITKQYGEALEIVFYSDFNPFASYYLIRELSKRSINKMLFVEYTFMICCKLKNIQKKVELISNIEDIVENSHECISKMIVKYKLYEVLNFLQDEVIGKNVVNILKNLNDRTQLINIYNCVDDVSIIIEILIDVFIEGIVTNINIDKYVEIFHNVKKRDESPNICKLEILYKFFQFIKSPDITTLKQISFFSVNFNLIEVKFVVEKVLKLACEVIKKAEDYELAKNLFKTVGEIELSGECIKYINKELILYI